MKTLRRYLVLHALVAGTLVYAQTSDRRPGFLGFGYTVHKTAASDATGWLHVRGVAPGSPAEKYGLKAQDLIVAIDGRALTFNTDADVILLLARIQAGQRVVLQTLRNQQKRDVTLTASPMTTEMYDRWRYNFELAREKARAKK